MLGDDARAHFPLDSHDCSLCNPLDRLWGVLKLDHALEVDESLFRGEAGHQLCHFNIFFELNYCT